MKYNIKRLLAATLLLAFAAPSSTALASYDTVPYTNATVLSGDVKLTANNDKITLSLRDSDVRQVLRMFADKAGMNVVFHSSVEGKVTLDLVDMPINEAFNLVLQVAGLNYYTQNNTLVVIAKDNADNAAFSKQEMMVFPVKYVNAGKVADFLNKNVFAIKKPGLSGVDAATVNSATNEIIIFGMPSDAAIVQKVIDQLDREPLSKTFTVNHTTPAEMADMICNMLLPSRGSSNSNDSSGGGFAPPTPGMGTTGGAAGIMTGGAASTGSSSDSELKLGEGIVACTVSANSSSSVAAPFDVQNLSISYFPQRGTITAMGGSEAQMQMISDFIKTNDLKQPQAYLEVSIVELTESGSKEFNNEWSIQSPNWFLTFSGTSTSGGRNSAPGTKKFVELQKISEDGSSLETTYMPVEKWYGAGSYISWQMNYLIENRKGRVLANPKLLITNGQESTIDLTQDYVEKVTSEYLSSTTSGTSWANGAVQRTYTIGEDQGIKVTLTPFISPEGYVTLNIKPEYSTIAEQVYAPSDAAAETSDSNRDLQATLLSRRNLDLKNIRIKDGETLVIGGLIQENETKTVGKIPILGDLPIIGAVFRTSTTSKTKNELVIMITPKIINDGESIADSL